MNESPYRVWATMEGARRHAANRILASVTEDLVIPGAPEVEFKTKWPDFAKPVEHNGEWKTEVVEKGDSIIAFEPVSFARRVARHLLVSRLRDQPDRKALGAPPRDVVAYAVKVLRKYASDVHNRVFQPHFLEVGTIAALGGNLPLTGPYFQLKNQPERCRANWPPEGFETPTEFLEYRKEFEEAFVAEFERLGKEEFEEYRAHIEETQDAVVMAELQRRNPEVAELIKLVIKRPDLILPLDTPNAERRRAAWNEVNRGVPFPEK